jgi:hypothetical protein
MPEEEFIELILEVLLGVVPACLQPGNRFVGEGGNLRRGEAALRGQKCVRGMADRQADAIKYDTEQLGLVVLLAVAIGDGPLSLVVDSQTPLRRFLAGVGILVPVG